MSCDIMLRILSGIEFTDYAKYILDEGSVYTLLDRKVHNTPSIKLADTENIKGDKDSSLLMLLYWKEFEHGKIKYIGEKFIRSFMFDYKRAKEQNPLILISKAVENFLQMNIGMKCFMTFD